MLWTPSTIYQPEPFEKEKDLEEAIIEVQKELFGDSRIYLDIKKKIGIYGKKQNIPDGYLIDLSSKKEPKLYVVENELAVHDPLRHIAVQILEFSLSFETTPQRVKEIIKTALQTDPTALLICQTYATENGFDNIDFLLETIIYKQSFNALVIIDEIPDDLETVLVSRFKFPVEILTLKRFRADAGEIIYEFEPFLSDVPALSPTNDSATLDPSDINTIVVPAREEGFQETFLGKDCWYAIRIHSSMIPKIKYVAAYQVAPVSAITHIAAVHKIEPYKETNKYILYFEESATKIKPIKLVPKGLVRAPQAPRYTAFSKLMEAKNLDEAF
ncbi:MAG: hypothetical protein CL608_28990 [Anaerolineaceae bacterium]|nr:hypothetical protein [Anaerolineaceae bacterium]